MAFVCAGFAILGLVFCLSLARFAIWFDHCKCRDFVLTLRSFAIGWSRRVDSFEQHISRELDSRRLAFSRKVANYMPVLASAGSAALVEKRLSAMVSAPRQRVFSETQDWMLMSMAVLCLIIWSFPQVVTMRSLDLLYSLFMAICSVIISPAVASSLHFSSSVMVIHACALVFSIFDPKPGLNTFWNSALCVTACVTVFVGETEFSGGLVQPLPFLLAEATFTFVILILLRCINDIRAQMVRLDIEVKVSKNELAAAHSVLCSVCEVVVELDSAFRLQRHSPGLATMLLLNPQRSLAGEDLRKFLSTEHDREKFEEHLESLLVLDGSPQELDQPRLSRAFLTTVQDSNGVHATMEVLCVCFQSRCGQSAFFVGIREFQDGDLVAMRRHRGSRGAARRTLRQPASPRPQDPCTIGAMVGRHDSDASCSSGGSVETFMSDGSASSFMLRAPLRPEYDPTPESTMTRALALLLVQFNHSVARNSCCWFHAAVSVVKHLRFELDQQPCENDFLPPVGGQCQKCRLLCHDDGEPGEPRLCELCGGEVRQAAPRSPAASGLAARLALDRGGQL